MINSRPDRDRKEAGRGFDHLYSRSTLAVRGVVHPQLIRREWQAPHINDETEFGARLRAAVADDNYRANLLPEALTTIAVSLLPIDGASLSLLSDELRMPLAASDDQARAAEVVQFSLGGGPCLMTYETGQAHTYSEQQLALIWPLYLAAVTQRTTYRSVASFPLALGDRLVGALDLYLDDPTGLPPDALEDATEVARLMADALAASPDATDGDPAGPVWLRNPSMQQRAVAWIAIGLVARAADLSADEALSVIRGYAWQHDQSVDAVSYDLSAHNLTADDLLGGEPP